MAVLTITSENFRQEVLNSDKPVLVDFWASWCGPCRMMGPVVDEVAATVPGVKVGKLNVEEQTELAIRYGVQNIPTLILFKNGQEAARAMGARPKAQVLELLQSAGVQNACKEPAKST